MIITKERVVGAGDWDDRDDAALFQFLEDSVATPHDILVRTLQARPRTNESVRQAPYATVIAGLGMLSVSSWEPARFSVN